MLALLGTGRIVEGSIVFDRGAGWRALLPPFCNLIPLLTILIDSQDADVTDVVMPTGIDATRYVQIQLADVILVVEIVEALLDSRRDRYRDRICQGTEITPRTANDVRNQANVGGRKL